MNGASTMTDIACDILIVGAGPAGLHAALAASGVTPRPRIVLVDENPQPGGQIWRRAAPAWARSMLAAADHHSIRYLPGTTVVQPAGDRSLLAVGPSGGAALRLGYESLILANGARELFLPFPGWTLPGVLGAGGLQAMVKSGLHITGKRIVVAGSGPLLLAVAAFLRRHGARVPAVVEQAPGPAIRAFAMSLASHPAKLVQAVGLKAALLGVPVWTDSWPLRASGSTSIEGITIRRGPPSKGQRTVEIPCDLLACGFGLVPNTHLAAMLGCRVESGRVATDELQRTSDPRVYCAGEPAGIGGVDTASIQGAIAGLCAAGQPDLARRHLPSRAKAQRFADRLNAAFALRNELRSLADDRTIICRCEDITLGQIRGHSSWREAKLQSRCGMGPCQGRVCGPIARYLLNLEPADARPPILPVELRSLAPPAPQGTTP